jgi:hypothetical protein
VVIKNSVFWNIKLCSPLKINRRFEETYLFHLQGGIINPTGDQPSLLPVLFWFLFSRSLMWRRQTPAKCLLIFNGIHSVISQKIEYFKIFLFKFSKLSAFRYLDPETLFLWWYSEKEEGLRWLGTGRGPRRCEADRQPGIDRAESVEVVRWGTVRPKITYSLYIPAPKSLQKTHFRHYLGLLFTRFVLE